MQSKQSCSLFRENLEMDLVTLTCQHCISHQLLTEGQKKSECMLLWLATSVGGGGVPSLFDLLSSY